MEFVHTHNEKGVGSYKCTARHPSRSASRRFRESECTIVRLSCNCFRGGVGCESSLLVPRRGQTVKVSSLLHVPRPIRSPSRDAQSNSDTLGQVTSARPIPNSRDNGTCYILPWHSTPAPTRAALSHPPRRSRPRSPWRPYAWSRRSRSRSPQRTRCVWVCTPSRALASICPR